MEMKKFSLPILVMSLLVISSITVSTAVGVDAQRVYNLNLQPGDSATWDVYQLKDGFFVNNNPLLPGYTNGSTIRGDVIADMSTITLTNTTSGSTIDSVVSFTQTIGGVSNPMSFDADPLSLMLFFFPNQWDYQNGTVYSDFFTDANGTNINADGLGKITYYDGISASFYDQVSMNASGSVTATVSTSVIFEASTGVMQTFYRDIDYSNGTTYSYRIYLTSFTPAGSGGGGSGASPIFYYTNALVMGNSFSWDTMYVKNSVSVSGTDPKLGFENGSVIVFDVISNPDGFMISDTTTYAEVQTIFDIRREFGGSSFPMDTFFSDVDSSIPIFLQPLRVDYQNGTVADNYFDYLYTTGSELRNFDAGTIAGNEYTASSTSTIDDGNGTTIGTATSTVRYDINTGALIEMIMVDTYTNGTTVESIIRARQNSSGGNSGNNGKNVYSNPIGVGEVFKWLYTSKLNGVLQSNAPGPYGMQSGSFMVFEIIQALNGLQMDGSTTYNDVLQYVQISRETNGALNPITESEWGSDIDGSFPNFIRALTVDYGNGTVIDNYLVYAAQNGIALPDWAVGTLNGPFYNVSFSFDITDSSNNVIGTQRNYVDYDANRGVMQRLGFEMTYTNGTVYVAEFNLIGGQPPMPLDGKLFFSSDIKKGDVFEWIFFHEVNGQSSNMRIGDKNNGTVFNLKVIDDLTGFDVNQATVGDLLTKFAFTINEGSGFRTATDDEFEGLFFLLIPTRVEFANGTVIDNIFEFSAANNVPFGPFNAAGSISGGEFTVSIDLDPSGIPNLQQDSLTMVYNVSSGVLNKFVEDFKWNNGTSFRQTVQLQVTAQTVTSISTVSSLDTSPAVTDVAGLPLSPYSVLAGLLVLPVLIRKKRKL